MVKIEILKKASSEALADINNLIAQLGLTNTVPKPLSLDGFGRLLSQKNFHLLVLKPEDRNQIIGMMSVYIVDLPTGPISIGEDLMVDRDYQVLGFGRLLVEGAISLARKQDPKPKHFSVRVSPDPRRALSNRLYLALGFQKKEANFYRVNF